MAILAPISETFHFVTTPTRVASRDQFSFLILLFLTMLLQVWATPAHAQQEHYTEYEVKAAFLYQFISFVEWPDDAFSDDDAPFIIGILGEDPFNETLDNIVKGKKAHNHNIAIKRSQDPEELKSCHLVFISASEELEIKQILETLSTSNILTIGESESFTEEGGIIRFLIHKNKIVFEINNKNAQEANLKISAQLLKLAQTATRKKERSS